MAAKVEIEQPELPNTTILKRIAYDNLIVQLESMHGAKDLVIDEELMKPLDRIAGVSVLKRHGVEKIFKLDKQNIETGCHRRIYITRPYISRMKMIVEHVRNDQLKSIHGEYKILLTPKRQLAVCELVLEREGIYGDVSIDEFPLDFISLDEDVLSMEMPLCFKDIYLNGDHTWTPIVARIINTIQSTYGSIRNYTCIGNSSKAIYDLLQVFTEDEKEFVPEGGPEIASAIIIDRDVDYVTPLLSQLSYEGLLADVFGISRFISFGRDVTGDEKTTRLVLDSNDKVFQEIRGLHFTSVFPLLSSKAKELQFGYDKRKDMTSVSELKNFVSQDLKLLKQQHKSLTIHLLDDTCTRETADFVEECINKQHSSLDSLRLLCLMSLTRASLDINRLKSLKLQYVQSFGYDRLITLNNLKKSGLLAEKPEVGIRLGVGPCLATGSADSVHLLPKLIGKTNSLKTLRLETITALHLQGKETFLKIKDLLQLYRQHLEYFKENDGNKDEKFGEEFVLCLLNILKCHLILSVKDKSIGKIIDGKEAEQLSKLLIGLIDLHLPENIQQAICDTMKTGAPLLLPGLLQQVELLFELLSEQFTSVGNISKGRLLQLEVILESLKDNYQVSKLFGFTESFDATESDSINIDIKLKISETLMKMLLRNLESYTVRRLECLKGSTTNESTLNAAGEDSIKQSIMDLLIIMQKHLLAFVFSKKPENENNAYTRMLHRHLNLVFSHAKTIVESCIALADYIDEKKITDGKWKLLGILSESCAGHTLMVIVHSLLLLPQRLIMPCFDDICDMLPGLDRVAKLSSAADVLEKQEIEWPKDGTGASSDPCGLLLTQPASSWAWIVDLHRAICCLIGRCVNKMLHWLPLSEEEQSASCWIGLDIFRNGLEEDCDVDGTGVTTLEQRLQDCLGAVESSTLYEVQPFNVENESDFYMDLANGPNRLESDMFWREAYQYATLRDLLSEDEELPPLLNAVYQCILATMLRHFGINAALKKEKSHCLSVSFETCFSIHKRFEEDIRMMKSTLLEDCKSIIKNCLCMLINVKPCLLKNAFCSKNEATSIANNILLFVTKDLKNNRLLEENKKPMQTADGHSVTLSDLSLTYARQEVRAKNRQTALNILASFSLKSRASQNDADSERASVVDLKTMLPSSQFYFMSSCLGFCSMSGDNAEFSISDWKVNIESVSTSSMLLIEKAAQGYFKSVLQYISTARSVFDQGQSHKTVFLYAYMVSLCATKLSTNDHRALLDAKLFDVLVDNSILRSNIASSQSSSSANPVWLHDMSEVLFKMLSLQVGMDKDSVSECLHEVVVQLFKICKWKIQLSMSASETEAELAHWLIFIKRFCLINSRSHEYFIQQGIVAELLDILVTSDLSVRSRLLALKLLKLILPSVTSEQQASNLHEKVIPKLLSFIPDVVWKEPFMDTNIEKANKSTRKQTEATAINATFDPTKSQGTVVENESGIVHSVSGKAIGLVNHPMKAGCYEWKMQICREVKGNEGTCIGIAKWPCKDLNYKTSSDVWLYRAHNGSLYHSGAVTNENLFSIFTVGDSITCVLDIERRVLMFGKNGEQPKVAFHNLPNVVFYPCVIFYGSSSFSKPMVKVYDLKMIPDGRGSCYTGDPFCGPVPFCAPVPFVLAEETVCLLRRLYQGTFWMNKLEKELLKICQIITRVSEENPKVERISDALKRLCPESFALLAFIGNIDNGLRLASQCTASDQVRGFIMGGTGPSSSYISFQQADHGNKSVSFKTAKLRPVSAPGFQIEDSVGLFKGLLKSAASICCVDCVATGPNSRDLDSKKPAHRNPDGLIEDELDCLYETQLLFCALKTVLKLVKSQLFSKLVFKHYHMFSKKRRERSSPKRGKQKMATNDDDDGGDDDEYFCSDDIELLKTVFGVNLQTSLQKNPFHAEFELEDIERCLAIFSEKISESCRTSNEGENQTASKFSAEVNADGASAKQNSTSTQQTACADETLARCAERDQDPSLPPTPQQSQQQANSSIEQQQQQQQQQRTNGDATTARSVRDSIPAASARRLMPRSSSSQLRRRNPVRPQGRELRCRPSQRPYTGWNYTPSTNISLNTAQQHRRERSEDRSPISMLLSRNMEQREAEMQLAAAEALPPSYPSRAAAAAAASSATRRLEEASVERIPASVQPLLEMGFSRRHINMALRANNGNDHMNAIVTWLLEHPLAEEEELENEEIFDNASPSLFNWSTNDDEGAQSPSVAIAREAVARSSVTRQIDENEATDSDDNFLLDSSDSDSGNDDDQITMDYGSLSESLVRQLFGELRVEGRNYNSRANPFLRITTRHDLVYCDICQKCDSPFNRHMRTHHPGCGSANSRFGYRSNGQYVDGWFGGTCGTGSPYYLLCQTCRQRYLEGAQQLKLLSTLPESHPFDLKLVANAPDLLGLENEDEKPIKSSSGHQDLEEPEIFALDPEENPNRNDQHMKDIGLSDCRFVPPVISFPYHDPLGHKATTGLVSPSPVQLDDDSAVASGSVRSLGQQADCLTDARARLYALDRISRACQVIVSRKIVYTMLEVLVKTLNFDEISQALVDLGIDNVQSLLDYLRMFTERSPPEAPFTGSTSPGNATVSSASKASLPVDKSVWNVVSVAVKVFLCKNSLSFLGVASYCISVLLNAAKDNSLSSKGQPSARPKNNLAEQPEKNDVGSRDELKFVQLIVELFACREVAFSITHSSQVDILLEIIDALSACCLSTYLEVQYRQWAAIQMAAILAVAVNKSQIHYTASDLHGKFSSYKLHYIHR
eukprot:gene9528-10514_t